MMVTYCTACWAENSSGEQVCRRCGAKLAGMGDSDYVGKLIRALDHREPTTPPRAAWILGQLAEHRALRPLIRALSGSRDSGLLAAAAAALGKIGDPEAIPALAGALGPRMYVVVRLAAVEALAAIGGAEVAKILEDVQAKDGSANLREAAARYLAR